MDNNNNNTKWLVKIMTKLQITEIVLSNFYRFSIQSCKFHVSHFNPLSNIFSI